MLKGLSIRYFIAPFFILLFWSNSSLALSLAGNDEIKSNLAHDVSSQLMPSNKVPFFSQLQPVFTLTAGTSISQLGQAQSIAPLDLCSYNYKPNGSNTTNMLWGGFIGFEVTRAPLWGLIAGLGYYHLNFLATKGSLTQGADPMSDNAYRYKYQTKSQQLLADGKLYWLANEWIQPFLIVGMGAAFNKTSDYQTSVPPFLEFTPAFSNHKQTNFTYAVGTGIDLILSKSFKIAVAYRFTDLGSANTGSGQIDTISIPDTLKQSHLYANQILAQLTFIP